MGLSHGIWEPWDVQIARMRGVNDAPIWERDSQGKLGLLYVCYWRALNYKMYRRARVGDGVNDIGHALRIEEKGGIGKVMDSFFLDYRLPCLCLGAYRVVRSLLCGLVF